MYLQHLSRVGAWPLVAGLVCTLCACHPRSTDPGPMGATLDSKQWHAQQVQALQHLADYYRQGYSCGLIADGSRGPARIAQKGPLYLARLTGGAIVPLAVAASRKKTFQTWDRFVLPLPFSRLALLVGEPLTVPPAARGAALEVLRQELEDRLNGLFHRAQDYFSA